MNLVDILTHAVEREASDILLIPGLPAAYKISGVITREGERLLPDALDAWCGRPTPWRETAPWTGWSAPGTTTFPLPWPISPRFRVNALRQRGSLALVIRVVSFSLPDRTALGIRTAS